MRVLTTGICLLALSQLAHADEISSVYTELNIDKDCTTFAINEEGGEFANLACNGYGGYPVLIYSADLRESIYYGFPKGGDLAPAWESFAAFNSAGPKIEWRVAKDGGRTIPFATIHRWSVSDPEDPDKMVEVLVVEKVSQLVEQDGCAVGLVRGDRQPQGQRDGAQNCRRAGPQLRLRRRRARAGRRADAAVRTPGELRGVSPDRLSQSCRARLPRRSSAWPGRHRASRRS